MPSRSRIAQIQYTMGILEASIRSLTQSCGNAIEVEQELEALRRELDVLVAIDALTNATPPM